MKYFIIVNFNKTKNVKLKGLFSQTFTLIFQIVITTTHDEVAIKSYLIIEI